MGPCSRVGNAHWIDGTHTGNGAANLVRSEHALGGPRSRFGTKFGVHFGGFLGCYIDDATSMSVLAFFSDGFWMKSG